MVVHPQTADGQQTGYGWVTCLCLRPEGFISRHMLGILALPGP